VIPRRTKRKQNQLSFTFELQVKMMLGSKIREISGRCKSHKSGCECGSNGRVPAKQA
jgi:hypothetical protein